MSNDFIKLDFDTLLKHATDILEVNTTNDFTQEYYAEGTLNDAAVDIHLQLRQHEEALSTELRQRDLLGQNHNLMGCISQFWSDKIRGKVLHKLLDRINILPSADKVPILLGMSTEIRTIRQGFNNYISVDENFADLVTSWYNACATELPQILFHLSEKSPNSPLGSLFCSINRPLSSLGPDYDHRAQLVEVMVAEDYGSCILSPEGRALIYLLEPEYFSTYFSSPSRGHNCSAIALADLLCGYQAWRGARISENLTDDLTKRIGYQIGISLVLLSKIIREAASPDFPPSFGLTGEGDMKWSDMHQPLREFATTNAPTLLHDSETCESSLKELLKMDFPFQGSRIMDGVTDGLISLETKLNKWVSFFLAGANDVYRRTMAQMMRDQKAYQYAIPQYSEEGEPLVENDTVLINRYSKSTLLEQLARYGLFFSFNNLSLLESYELERNLSNPDFYVPVLQMANKTNSLARAYYQKSLARELSCYGSDGEYKKPENPKQESTYMKGLHSLVMAIRIHLMLYEWTLAKYDSTDDCVVLSQGTIDHTLTNYLPHAIYKHMTHLEGTLFPMDMHFVSMLLPIVSDHIKAHYPKGYKLHLDEMHLSILKDEGIRHGRTFTPAQRADISKSKLTNDNNNKTNLNDSPIKPKRINHK